MANINIATQETTWIIDWDWMGARLDIQVICIRAELVLDRSFSTGLAGATTSSPATVPSGRRLFDSVLSKHMYINSSKASDGLEAFDWVWDVLRFDLFDLILGGSTRKVSIRSVTTKAVTRIHDDYGRDRDIGLGTLLLEIPLYNDQYSLIWYTLIGRWTR